VTPAAGALDSRDAALVAWQLGREPRGTWRVASICRWRRPSSIATAPVLDSGEPFPTVLWLTCPWLAEHVGGLESRGGTSEWAARAVQDSQLRASLEAADLEYRALRIREGGGEDPCGSTGIAGQRDASAVKCLHAHVAASLGGIGDPIGAAVLEQTGDACSDDRCGEWLRTTSGVESRT
jgi:hypothetical protein